jgi:hypothetical protein
MTQQADMHTLAVKVGEISGQLRELIHNQNNMAQKIDGMTERLLTGPTAEDFAKLHARVDKLEAERDRCRLVRCDCRCGLRRHQRGIFQMKLIEEWRQAWRYTSVWASGAGIGVLTAWNMMPMAVRDQVPDWMEALVGGVLFGLVFLARVTAQPKAQEKINAAK